MCNCNESSMGQMSNEKTLADAAREGLRREDVVAHMCQIEKMRSTDIATK